ncbi:TPA: hypothetical protein ACGQSM_003698 [Serratia liquefaciens]
MAKRKSNRAVRWLFGMKAKASNRRKVWHYCRFSGWDASGSWVIVGIEPVKPSARQNRARKNAHDFSGIVYGDCRNYS